MSSAPCLTTDAIVITAYHFMDPSIALHFQVEISDKLLLMWLTIATRASACQLGATRQVSAHSMACLPHKQLSTAFPTLMPAARQVSMAGPTSGRGGSCIAATPRKVSPASSSGVTCAAHELLSSTTADEHVW